MARLLAAPCLWRDFGWKDRQRITKKPSPSWHIGPQWFKIPKWKGFISISGGNQKESLAQWLIPSTFQFPALESQGIRALQRRILAEGNVFCPSFILGNGEAFLALCCRFQPLFPPEKPQTKHPIPQTITPLFFRKYLTLRISVPWCSKFQTRGSEIFSQAVPGTITGQFCPLSQSKPPPDAQDAFYIQTHTCNLQQL